MIELDQNKFSKDQHDIHDYWDARVPSQHEGTSFADLAEYHKMNPLLTPRVYLNFMVYDFDAWAHVRWSMKNMTSIYVELQAGYVTQHNSEAKQRRFIQADFEFTVKNRRPPPALNEVPTLGTIFEGIRNSKISSI